MNIRIGENLMVENEAIKRYNIKMEQTKKYIFSGFLTLLMATEREDKKVNKNIKGVFLALLAGCCWGLSGNVGQFLFSRKGIEAGWLTVIRMIVSGIILLVMSLAKKNDITGVWKQKNTAIRLLLFSIIGLMLVQHSYMKAIQYSNAGTTTAIQYLGMALILLVVCVTDKRWPKKFEIFGLTLAIVGVFLLATHGEFQNLNVSKLGLFWGLTSALAMMLYTLLPGKLIEKFDSMTITGYGMLIGGVILIFLVKPWKYHVRFDLDMIVALATIILPGTVIAFTAYLQSNVNNLT